VEAQEMLLKWEAKEPEVYGLWETMNGWVYRGFEKTYEQMGVTFDELYYESQTYLLGKEKVQLGIENGVFYRKKDNSVWVDLTEDGLDEKILLRSDGTAVYMTQDIGTAIHRFEAHPGMEKLVYTVGNEQDYHFKVLFLILKKLGFKWAEGCYHLSYGMVDLPSGKMKSREGTVVDADDLMDEMQQTAKKHTQELGKIDGFTEEQAEELYRVVGIGALKYFLLKVDPKKRMLFDPEESIQFHGNTGPFIQYTHARICAIIRKAKEMDYMQGKQNLTFDFELHEHEREVIYLLSLFGEKITEAAIDYSPYVICQYIFDLAKEYNKFYQEVSIFNEPDQDKLMFRIAFSETVARTIKTGMGLMGIEVPERM
jgi:arginyl-tRNA synthetase